MRNYTAAHHSQQEYLHRIGYEKSSKCVAVADLPCITLLYETAKMKVGRQNSTEGAVLSFPRWSSTAWYISAVE